MPTQIRTGRYLLGISIFVAGTAVGFTIAYFSGLRPSIVPVVSAILGLLVAFSVPVWQALFVNAPNLSVEISAISRTISDLAVVQLEDYPELASLRPVREREFISGITFGLGEVDTKILRGKTRGLTQTDLEELLIRAKQRLRDLPAQIEERKKDLERVKGLTPSSFTKYEADRLNQPISPEVDFDPESKENTLEAFREAYQRRFDALEKQYTDLQTNLPIAERKIDSLRTELINNRSYFTVSASLINSGRSNTAIKVPALLRVSIGEGNYIDIKLTLKDFENKSEISANGTRIVVFESSEVSSMPEEDRRLINTYWGQSVNSRLFLEDIHSRVYFSNRIAFAEGLYQKIIYDRLARAATD